MCSNRSSRRDFFSILGKKWFTVLACAGAIARLGTRPTSPSQSRTKTRCRESGRDPIPHKPDDRASTGLLSTPFAAWLLTPRPVGPLAGSSVGAFGPPGRPAGELGRGPDRPQSGDVQWPCLPSVPAPCRLAPVPESVPIQIRPNSPISSTATGLPRWCYLFHPLIKHDTCGLCLIG